MTPEPRHDRPILSTPAPRDDELLAALVRDRQGCPDFTRSIMGRLGYMKAAEAVCRRRRVLRWIERGVLAAAALVAVVAGIQIFNAGPSARRPVQTPIHEAFERDVRERAQGLGQVIQILQRITPPELPEAKPDTADPVEASEAGQTLLPREAKGFRWI